MTERQTVAACAALINALTDLFGSVTAADVATDGLASGLAEVVRIAADASASAAESAQIEAGVVGHLFQRKIAARGLTVANQERVVQQRELDAAICDATAALEASQATARQKGQDRLTSLQAHAGELALIALFSEDSAEDTELRAVAAREAFAEMVARLSASESLTAELLAAFDAVSMTAAANPSGAIAAAASSAAQLAANLGIATGHASALVSTPSFTSVRDTGGEVIYDSRDPRLDAGVSGRRFRPGRQPWI